MPQEVDKSLEYIIRIFGTGFANCWLFCIAYMMHIFFVLRYKNIFYVSENCFFSQCIVTRTHNSEPFYGWEITIVVSDEKLVATHSLSSTAIWLNPQWSEGIYENIHPTVVCECNFFTMFSTRCCFSSSLSVKMAPELTCDFLALNSCRICHTTACKHHLVGKASFFHPPISYTIQQLR